MSCSGDSNGNGSRELYEPDLERDERSELQILQRLRDENLGHGHVNDTFWNLCHSVWHVSHIRVTQFSCHVT